MVHVDKAVFDERFWRSLDRLVDESEVIVDQPAGSAHPRYPEYVYPFDYGYLAATSSTDGGGIDVWIGSLGNTAVVGIVLSVDLHMRDAEIKLLLGCTPQEAQRIKATHNENSQAGILILRENTSASAID